MTGRDKRETEGKREEQRGTEREGGMDEGGYLYGRIQNQESVDNEAI